MNMDQKTMVALGVCLILCLAIPIEGQLRDQDIAARERVRENLNRLRLLRMTEELELREDQTAVIFPAAARLEKEKAEISRKIGQEIRDLRAMLRSGAPDSQALGRKVRAIKELRRSLQEKELEFEKILEENLDEVQKAKYLLFTLDFYRMLGEKLDRARKIFRNKREF